MWIPLLQQDIVSVFNTNTAMFLLYLFLYIIIPSISSAAPLPPEEIEPLYVSDPSGRGTIEFLWSCILTLTLCIWTAMHPDVVAANEWYTMLYKAYWTILSAIFPEFLVCCAIAQLKQARELHNAWIEKWGDREQKDWLGMPGAFFVVMGGYVITEGPLNQDQEEAATENQGENKTSANNGEPEGAPNQEQQEAATENQSNNKTPGDMGEAGGVGQVAGLREDHTPDRNHVLLGHADTTETEKQVVWNLTVAGMKELLNSGELEKLIIKEKILNKEHFDFATIEDKSKANNIAKALVSLQIIWVVIQCIGRYAQGLPVTLLETHILTRMFPSC